MMTVRPITIEASTMILDAAHIFQSKKISTVPVIGVDGSVFGLATEMGMVRAVVLHQLQPDHYKQMVHCKELLDPPSIVQANDSIATVVSAMMKCRNHRVLVRSGGPEIVGIISPKDLLKLLNTSGTVNSTLQAEIHRLN